MIGDCGATVQDLQPLASEPCVKVLHPPKGGALTKLVGADGDSVQKFLDLGQAGRAGDNRANTVACQAVGFGEGIKLDQRIVPVGIGKQIMRRTCAAVEMRLSKSR